jgi:hypothetical protein
MKTLSIDLVDLDEGTVRLTDGTVVEIEFWEDQDGFQDDEPLEEPAAIIFRLPWQRPGEHVRLEIDDPDAAHILH